MRTTKLFSIYYCILHSSKKERGICRGRETVTQPETERREQREREIKKHFLDNNVKGKI